MLLDPSTDPVTLLHTVIDIESVSGNKRRFVDLVEKVLRTQPHLKVARDGDYMVARTRLDRVQRVLIADRLDTVPVTGNLPNTVEGTPEGVIIHGRDTMNMRGGVAAVLKLAYELDRPRFGIIWVFYDHEEADASLNGLGRLAGSHPNPLEGGFAVLMGPTGARIEGGCQGTIRIRITAEGKVAHSACAWMGDDAVRSLANVLARLATHGPKRIGVDGLEYREELNAVRIGRGVAGNIIPPEAWVGINYQLAPDKSLDRALGYLEEVFNGYTSEVADLSSATRPGLDRPLAQEFVDAVGGKAFPKYGWTGVSHFSTLGVPAVNYGPGDSLLAYHNDGRCLAEYLRICADGLRRWFA